MSLYKPHEISGCVDTELTPELYRSWGRTLGRQVEPRAKFVVGGDVRRQTPRVPRRPDRRTGGGRRRRGRPGHPAHARGLLRPAPPERGRRGNRRLLLWRRRLARTALALGRRWPTPEQVALLRREAEDPSPLGNDRKPALPRRLNVSFDYVGWLQETWIEAQAGELRVVVDPMYGCNSARARLPPGRLSPLALLRDPRPAGRRLRRPRARLHRPAEPRRARHHGRARAGRLGDCLRRRRRPRGFHR